MVDYAENPELSAEQQAILRRRKLAELIQAQSLQPIDLPQAGRGFVRPIGGLESLGKLGQAYLGRTGVDEANTAERGLAQKAQTAEQEAMANYIKSRSPMAAIPVPETGGPGRPEMARPQTELDAANIEAQVSPYKRLQVSGALNARLDEQAKNDARDAKIRAEQAQLAAEAKAEAALLEANRRKESQTDKQAAEERLQKLLIANRPPAAITPVTLEDPDDPTKTIVIDGRTKEVLGRGINAAAKASADEKKKAKEDARTGFESSLANLEAKYKELDEMGGIVNPDKSGLSNIGARLSASGVGQVVGGAVGTNEQSIRNEIMGTIPLLVLDIKNLTGASAQQMNSNVELQNFLKAASSPTSDIRANLQLLKNLRTKYLGGETVKPTDNAAQEETWVRDSSGKLVKK